MSEVAGDISRAKLGALLLLTESGTPIVYYGEEIGMGGIKSPAPNYDKTRREPMDWYAGETGPGMTNWFKPAGRSNKPNDGISIEEQQGRSDSLLAYYRKLIALRNANPALRTGSREKIELGNAPLVYAYLRRDSDSAFLVVINTDSQPVSVTLDLGASSLPDGEYKASDLLTDHEVSLNGLALALHLDASTGVLLRLASR